MKPKLRNSHATFTQKMESSGTLADGFTVWQSDDMSRICFGSHGYGDYHCFDGHMARTIAYCIASFSERLIEPDMEGDE